MTHKSQCLKLIPFLRSKRGITAREPKYFDIACRRIEDAQRMGDMFGFNGTSAQDLPKQEVLV